MNAEELDPNNVQHDESESEYDLNEILLNIGFDGCFWCIKACSSGDTWSKHSSLHLRHQSWLLQHQAYLQSTNPSKSFPRSTKTPTKPPQTIISSNFFHRDSTAYRKRHVFMGRRRKRFEKHQSSSGEKQMCCGCGHRGKWQELADFGAARWDG